VPCTQCLQSGAQQTHHHLECCTHLHTVACLFDCLASLPCGCSFLTAAHEPGALPGHCALCCTYGQHTPCCTQTHTHTCLRMYANVLLFPIPSNRMSQRCARVPFLLCKFHAHACSNRLCQRYALCSTFYVYFTHGCGSNAEGSCLLRAWSGCSVITGFLQQPTSSGAIQGDIAAGVQAQALHGISHDSPPTCLLHSLLLQACSGCSMGTGFAQQHSSTHWSVEQS
jgi:hypothetical protein